MRNEFRNLERVRENLNPKWRFEKYYGVGGFTELDVTAGALIKCYDEARAEFVVGGEHEWQTTCVVCFERPREVVLRPCNHACVCAVCRRNLGGCPICRGRIEETVTLEYARSNKIPYTLSTRGPWSEGYTGRLLRELGALR